MKQTNTMSEVQNLIDQKVAGRKLEAFVGKRLSIFYLTQDSVNLSENSYVEIDGVEIISPERLKELAFNSIVQVLITSTYRTEIEFQLKDIGIDTKSIY